MNVEQLKQDIIEYAKEIGIDKIGFTTADPFTTLKERLIKQQQLNYQSGFEEPDIDKRTNPALLLEGAASIISIAVAYPTRMKENPKGKKGARRGLFARASWGEDYHTVLRNRLQKLEEFIKSKIPEARTKSMVDTGELSDRAVAERAGIGWSGKNCAIITPEYGSFVYLGEMITNIPFEPDQPIEDLCGDCNKCLEACPTGALVQGGQINAKICISYLTQTKDFLPEQYRSVIGNRLYGCDTCQIVCPYNRGVDFHLHEELEPEPEIAKPLLTPLLSISNREFKEKFGRTSGAWRGKKPIQRNAIIALGHFKEESAIDDLQKVLKDDPRPVIRGTAAWALGRIGTEKAKEVLLNALEKEKDEEVLNEIELALAK
ncbi:tRNA epoxyqueuosine(34) reductase QueG [Pallidibacillus pasinlerensis]|uniref:Epoxyqueuosine reductase n=1 Tax=Pallidibacillus pasinlerensis TaxID=2703818 RepID=A0ABX0A0D8_9BACI|nr:tRNA epoxyqueuosine(34) reductase QueG [Pallidibacillus pasinlerensis]NCU16864.1 tRNA epoxyqueuosine(34) reductase QueG [Pallidibacillus pasinlerensis]